MYVGSLGLELYMPQCRNLKDKRQIIKSILDRTSHRFNVAVAEVDYHELWQRSSLGIACVGVSEHNVREVLDRVDRSIRALGKAEVLESSVTVFKVQE